MKTQDITAELEAAIRSLVNQGKEPTVALVKTRMTTPAPIPAIIAAIKSWKSSSFIPKLEVTVNDTSKDKRITDLEETVLDLTQRIEKLESQIS
jgi:hypothetical protein